MVVAKADAPAEATALRLLDAAERLVGERGVDAVSLRAINAAAGSNVAAVHYHFGSKAGLVRAVLDRRMAVLGRQRSERVAPLESEPAPSARAVAAAFVEPLFLLSRDPERAPYVRFLAALGGAGGEWLGILSDAFASQGERIGPVLARATPQLDEDRRGRRLALASETMLRMLGDHGRYGGTLGGDDYLNEVIDIFTAILTAPTEDAR